MSKIKTAWEILEEWGITNPTEDDMWEAIAEADDYQRDYYRSEEHTSELQSH